MAFGFGFNKQKVLSAAEKFVQQGKLQNAIAEYEKIRKHDEKDLTVANTIGDLYARLGDTEKAIECFKSVGDAYAAQGFTVKGIAMYKKITKLQPSVDGSLKLAELYTQQGLFNDARAQYLQVAEDFMKNGELEQAVRLFQKVLEMDPENVPMRVKLAEVYVKLGKKKEAWEIFSAAAESLRARGSLAAAEDILQRMLTLDPGNSYVLLMRGRAALESDDPKAAIQFLEKAPDIDSHPEGLRDLLKAYIESGDLAKCTPLAEKLLAVHNDPEGLFLLGEGAGRLGFYNQSLEIYCKHADRLLATDSTKLLANLHGLIAHVQDDAPALEHLLELLKKSGESTHVNEVTELLAHASVKNENLERARDLYQTLATAEPQNPLHAQNCQQVTERIAGSREPAVREITAEEGALIVEELEATAPIVDQSYPDQIAIAVRAAVTDADLFLSYNLPEKALVPLLGALPQAPSDVRLNQRLAALHTRARRFAEAAVCCRTLESAYHDAGYPDEALRYGELAARYEQNTGGAAVVDAAAPAAETAGRLPQATESPEFSIDDMTSSSGSEVQDVSAEWEDALTVDDSPAAVASAASSAGAAASDPEIAETAEEIRFYLEHFMTDQARAAFEKLEKLTHDPAVLDPLRAAFSSAAKPAEEPEPEVADINADEPATFEIEVDAHSSKAIANDPGLLVGYDHGHDGAAPAAFHAEELEPTHQQVTHFGVTPAAHAEVEPAQVELVDVESADHEPAHAEAIDAEPIHAQAAPAEGNELTALVADLESSLGDSFMSPSAVEAEASVAPAFGGDGTVKPRPGAPAHGKPGMVPTPAPQSAPATLPGWSGAAAAKPAFASSAQAAAAETSHESVAAPVEPVVAKAPASGGAAAAASPALVSYGPSPVRPLGTDAQAESGAGVDLSQMFGDLKQELEEEASSSDEDPETHYNLGVAFREMGLLDEAIAELQKVYSAIEHGHPFTQTVQAYTWLAQCFLDKGVPAAAISWYEKALNIPGIDAETQVAINYELGSACESADDKPAALRHFTYVYGANIDYRDVAERIQALKS